MVTYYITGKIRKKVKVEKKKGWFGKEIEEIPVLDAEKLERSKTLAGETKEILKILEERGIKPSKKVLRDALEHTHCHIYTR